MPDNNGKAAPRGVRPEFFCAVVVANITPVVLIKTTNRARFYLRIVHKNGNIKQMAKEGETHE